MSGGGPQQYRTNSFQLRGVERVGNYALQPNWADGHNVGIWTFERLRQFCACDECETARKWARGER